MENDAQRAEAVGRSEDGSGGLDTRPGENAAQGANIQSPGRVCRLCGGPILDVSRTRPRLQHRSCTKLLMYARAAAREAAKIGAESPGQARAVRAVLFGAVNTAVPARWQRPRDGCGRFLPLGRD